MIKGSKHSEKSLMKMSLAFKGSPSWNKGLKGYTNGGSFKAGHKAINTPMEEDHYRWKGDKVGYSALHKWVKKQLGIPHHCDECGTKYAKRFDWANKSGEYKRQIDDWISLCRSCHVKIDRNKKGISARDTFIIQNRIYDTV